MDCAEKRDLQRKCSANWDAYAEYAGAIKQLTTPGTHLTVMTSTMEAFFRKSPSYVKARNEYHESVRALEQHLVQHRC
jgi:hypothetical protein